MSSLTDEIRAAATDEGPSCSAGKALQAIGDDDLDGMVAVQHGSAGYVANTVLAPFITRAAGGDHKVSPKSLGTHRRRGCGCP